MLYETRKVLLGFRLKLTFDLCLNKDISCIFVDVLKTPTVGLLLNNIIERFKIPHNSFLTVQNCKVLPSESIYVLLDINSAKINGPSASKNEVHGIQPSVVTPEKNVPQQISSDIISCDGNEGDVVDGKSKIFPKPKPPKRPIREGIAATIKMLLEEEEMDKIRKECSGLSISNDISKIQNISYQKSMNVVDEVAETNLHCEELSDLASDACSDLNVEKKKRKRKRKHAKNHEFAQPEDQPPSVFNETDPVFRENTERAFRKHIRFGDIDGESLDHSSIMETDDASGSETSVSCSKNQNFPRKSTKIQDQLPTTTTSNMKSKHDYNMEESYKRPKSSLSLYSGKISKDNKTCGINSYTDSDNSVSAFINLPRLSEAEKERNKPKHDQVEKELATLLMCKQLNTCMEYTVQFANEKGTNFFSKSPSSLKGVESGPINTGQSSVVSQANQFAEKLNTSSLISQNVKTEGNYENDTLERFEASSDDCEFLKQVKLNGNRIHLRKSDGTWTVLTSEIANAELPKLDLPKENQSVVFRIVYLNHMFCPTLSELLYGRIVSYKADTNKLAIDIPHEFLEAILNDCGEGGLPETILPITGSTFEVDLSTLIEPKTIS